MKITKTIAGFLVLFGLLGMGVFAVAATTLANANSRPDMDLYYDLGRWFSILAGLACAGVFFWGALVFSRKG
jgi:hypothetical protein